MVLGGDRKLHFAAEAILDANRLSVSLEKVRTSVTCFIGTGNRTL